MTLQAYVDDSRSNVDARHFILAGYVHSAEKWSQFSDDWKAELNTPPKIEYFRMVEAENLRGQFIRWPWRKREQKVNRLAKVIHKYNPWSFECWLSEKAFNKILKPIAPYDLKNPYMYCFYGVIVTVARLLQSEGIKAPVDFVFDEQGGLGPRVVFWYDWIKQWQDPSIAALLGNTPVFRDDKKVLPLQAADILAWHLRRKKESRYLSENRKLHKHIFGNHIQSGIDEVVLRELVQKMSQVPGVQAVQSKKTSIWRLLREPRKGFS